MCSRTWSIVVHLRSEVLEDLSAGREIARKLRDTEKKSEEAVDRL